jgi:hypothetical protein
LLLETKARTDSLAKVLRESCESLVFANCPIKIKRGMKSGIARMENSTDALPRSSRRAFFLLVDQPLITREKFENFTVDSQLALIHLPLFLALFL